MDMPEMQDKGTGTNFLGKYTTHPYIDIYSPAHCCKVGRWVKYHIEAWLESFSRGNREPECTFLSQIESIGFSEI